MRYAVHEPSISPVFRADHPFIFAIKDNKTGLVLFMGRVVDPTA
ncbi:MAG: serpin family protein [Thaumarchaeota archaeon]|nr:MAG: serpin family protein [Nitrososphaerota archaeon]